MQTQSTSATNAPVHVPAPHSRSPVSSHSLDMGGQDQDQDQYLTFQIGREIMAIGIQPIREILEYSSPTDVPMMPKHVRGVINLRGAVVPVVDLAARLGRPDTNVSKKTCIVIIETQQDSESQTFGVMVDAVHAVIGIAASEIEPPPSFGSSIRNDFLQGLGKVNGKFVVILQMRQVLNGEDLMQGNAAQETIVVGTQAADISQASGKSDGAEATYSLAPPH